MSNLLAIGRYHTYAFLNINRNRKIRPLSHGCETHPQTVVNNFFKAARGRFFFNTKDYIYIFSLMKHSMRLEDRYRSVRFAVDLRGTPVS